MVILEIMMELSKNGVDTSLHYYLDEKQFAIELKTGVSNLFLFEDGMLSDRHHYNLQLDLSKDVHSLVTELCEEFNKGREDIPFPHHNRDWIDLCDSKNVILKQKPITNIKLPKFVKLNHVALRLRGKKYYRDGGQWGVGYKVIDGELISWVGRVRFNTTPWLHEVPLIEITEEEWRKDNGQYAPKNI